MKNQSALPLLVGTILGGICFFGVPGVGALPLSLSLKVVLPAYPSRELLAEEVSDKRRRRRMGRQRIKFLTDPKPRSNTKGGRAYR